MKKATVRDLRNNFSRLEVWIEEGEQIVILKRGHPIAHLVPCSKNSHRKIVKPDILARLKETWGSRIFSTAEVEAMRQAELEGDEG